MMQNKLTATSLRNNVECAAYGEGDRQDFLSSTSRESWCAPKHHHLPFLQSRGEGHHSCLRQNEAGHDRHPLLRQTSRGASPKSPKFSSTSSSPHRTPSATESGDSSSAPQVSSFQTLLVSLRDHPHSSTRWCQLIESAERSENLENIKTAYETLLEFFPNTVGALNSCYAFSPRCDTQPFTLRLSEHSRVSRSSPRPPGFSNFRS
ncbi:hypothetical protein SISSUDRAFT_718858 [Sistotremastrum suecicum HHB10207 ss-3]|uniref:Uncharacterized protein n=1 Tax=Sistotremastrum suecicum HHB10207 ss-3 TaxID=1314776 RepID=A0A166DN65_9AGAM|nr:hypothetical protein SISSUDRAFT_718858 [Sistotremastrum suecicum HHB10207 ss-3]